MFSWIKRKCILVLLGSGLRSMDGKNGNVIESQRLPAKNAALSCMFVHLVSEWRTREWRERDESPSLILLKTNWSRVNIFWAEAITNRDGWVCAFLCGLSSCSNLPEVKKRNERGRRREQLQIKTGTEKERKNRNRTAEGWTESCRFCNEGKKKEFREILEGKDGKEIRQFRL